MRVVRGAYFWQFGSIASLPTEITNREILVAFLAQTWPQKRSQSAKFKKFSWGGHTPDPPTLFTLTHTQWPYQSEIAGAGPGHSTLARQLCDDTRLPGWLSAFPVHSQTFKPTHSGNY